MLIKADHNDRLSFGFSFLPALFRLTINLR